MALGVNFAPGSREEQQPQPQQPLQEAIKLLSLRLPQVVGANSPIPAPLLQGQGSMGQGDQTGNPLLDMLRRLLGGMAPQQDMMGVGAPNMMGMPGPPQGPGRTGRGVPMPEPGPLPLPGPFPNPKPRVIPIENPPQAGPGPMTSPWSQPEPDIPDIDRQMPPMY